MEATEVAVREVRSVGPDTVALELETPTEFDAEPGQFVQLRATIDDGEEITRHYTLSSPNVADTFEITVGVDPDGDLSPWLAALEPGETVEIAGPYGHSYYEGEERAVVIAGGPGVGPAVGIGERALADGNEVAVVYQDDEPAHEDRLSALSKGGATVFVVTDGLSGAVEKALEEVDGTVFVYGFAEFLEDTNEALEAAGYDPEEAKRENFGPAP